MSKIEKEIISVIQESIKKIMPDCPSRILSDVYLEVPKEKKFGDFSVNIAMRLTKDIKKPPMDIAASVVEEIKKLGGKSAIKDLIEDIKIERPGFINFYISKEAAINALLEMLKEGAMFGKVPLARGKKAQIEFVSANPTGPLTVAHGRQAAVGDSLARIMEFCGYKVTREYYINDEGVQMDLLGRSVRARYLELVGEKVDFPEDGYKGNYVYEIAKEIKDKFGAKEKELPQRFFTEYACKNIMATIKKDLQDFGVNFDVWYSQKALSKSGKIEKALLILKKKRFLYEKDGATWFKSSALGDDKDRVVIKNDGTFTYLTPDIAYHKEKFEKGYERIVNIWGPDHHGYINRLKAACQALGFNRDNVSILISQLVTLYRDKKPVRMSTREGEFVTLREVIDEVGKDAARFFFIMRRTDSHLDFDLELAKSKTMDNPVYYIQYAHARISSVVKFSGAPLAGKGVTRDCNLHLLDKPEEINIIKALMQFPNIIESSAQNLEPYILLAYLQDLASLFHSYYDAHRIVTDDKALTKARIALIAGLKTMFFNGLTLLGVNAPEKM